MACGLSILTCCAFESCVKRRASFNDVAKQANLQCFLGQPVFLPKSAASLSRHERAKSAEHAGFSIFNKIAPSFLK